MSFSADAAETLALRALAWLVGNEELLPVFLGSTGVGEDELRDRAGESEFLASVLDFLMMDDAWVVGFCDATNTPYEDPMKAQAVLSGKAQMHWT